MRIITDDYCSRCSQNTAHIEEELMDAIIIKCLDCWFERIDSLDDYYGDDFEP